MLKWRWSTISSISTKRTITFHPNSLNTKRHTRFEIHALSWERYKNEVNGIPTPPAPLDNMMSNCNTYNVYTNDKKPTQIRFHTKGHILSQK